MDRRILWFLGLFAPVLIWSWINPFDRFTWWLESIPALAGIPILIATHRRFPLSTLLLVLIWIESVILVTGGHYTYARVPLGDWAEHWFGWSRNNYDKLGHFWQGFMPAFLARELLKRKSPIGKSKWLPFLVVCICLAFSAFYELVEWFTAVTQGGAATDFLGTQGDPWDTQTDMLTALIAALVAIIFFSRLHDWSLKRLAASHPESVQ